MKLLINVEYQTTFGESLVLNILPNDDAQEAIRHQMSTLDGLHWFCEISMKAEPETYIDYYYSVMRGDDEARKEWLMEPHRLEFAAQKAKHYTVYDHWIDIPEDAYMYSSARTFRRTVEANSVLALSAHLRRATHSVNAEEYI